MTKPRIAVIVGSIRDNRFGLKPAQWIFEHAKKRGDIAVELVDLKDYPLPLFNAAASDLWVPATDPAAIRWQNKLNQFDGFIFVTAEYNRSITGALKNALDQAYINWNKKPFGAVGYGAVGGARAVEHLRTIGVELQMVPVRSAVHIGGSDFFAVHPLGGQNKSISDIEGNLAAGANDMLDQIAWWGNATKAARTEDAAAKQAAE